MQPVNPHEQDRRYICELSMRELNAALVKIVAFVILVAFVGCVLSAVLTLWFVNGPNYTGDCNCGLGLLGIGCAASWVITPIGLYIRWFIKHNFLNRDL
jgi:hypothetical protein